jgi:beta-lactamase regulating signal transducer with metallopeptidase domain
MGIFLAYTIKTAFLLSLFYLLNRVFLEKETFHKLNRILWILIVPLSYILASIDIRKDVADSLGLVEVPLTNAANPLFYRADMPVNESFVATIVTFIIVLGSFAFAIIWAINIFKLKQGLVHSSSLYGSLLNECKNNAGVSQKVNLYIIKGNNVPSSWMNNIIISENDISINGKEILMHELSHIKHGHSWDIFLADLLIIVQWFNPASWLLKRAMRQVHEYQADEEVIKSGINAKQYQLLLIEKAVGKRLYSMANSFNHSKLKNRISMMLKEKSNKWNYAKCLYMIPLALASVSLFAVPGVSSKMVEISNLEFTRFVSITPQKTEQNLLKEQDPPIYIVDGKEVENIEDIPSEAIESISVLKDEKAVEKYGERAKNGVIEVTLKEEGTYAVGSGEPIVVRGIAAAAGSGDPIVVRGISAGGIEVDSISSINSVAVVRAVGSARSARFDTTVQVYEAIQAMPSDESRIIVRGYGTNNQKNPDLLYIVNGKEASDIENIPPESIESIEVIKDKDAVNLYGDKAKNGVIIITLK